MAEPTPPIAARHPVTTRIHGVDRVDPYAWMRDPAETDFATYLDRERAYYDARVRHLSALHATLSDEMIRRVPAEEASASWDAGGWTYREVTPAGRDHRQLRRRPRGADQTEDAVILDLFAVAETAGSDHCQTGATKVSPDGRLLAWSVDVLGDEVFILRFRDLATGLDLDDVVGRSYYGGAWSEDSTKYLYTTHDDAYRPYQVWCHTIGMPVTSDVLVYEDSDVRFEVEIDSSRTGAWIMIQSVARDTREVWLISKADVMAAPRLVRPRVMGVEYNVEHAPGHGPDDGDGFLIITNDDAVEFRLAWAPAEEIGTWVPVLGEDPRVRLKHVDAFADAFVLSLRLDGHQTLRVVSRSGHRHDITPDVPGGGVWLAHNEEYDATSVTVAIESFIHPTVWWDVDLATQQRAVRHRGEALGVDPDMYVHERRMVADAEGIGLPVVLIRHRDTDLNGTAPCVLYGYGAYEVCCDPDFGFDWWRSLPSLLDRGVVFAVGHPRGGGELGRKWWLDGRLEHKTNTFADYAAIADALADDFVDGSRIVTRGLSAGGLLQAVVYSRYPRRWAGVVAEVPFVDVVTTMLDETVPLTAQEWAEWGDPRDPDDFDYMADYSPYENRPSVEMRPPLLVTGAVHDPRVLIREPAKWVAALRADDAEFGVGADPRSSVSARSVLFRVETGSGAHGGPTGRFAQLDYEAEIYAWCLAALGVVT